ncbi:MAG TPA: shikimate kinase [Acidimicrobiales bacterium]|nr:shikimate kinase [Acidimicrobiales bacterium]
MAPLQPHLVLIGMMGAGKTSVGRRLARRLGWRHVDADKRIERTTGRTIAEIFAEDGEAGFRAIEHDVLETLLRLPGRTVVSTGGGAVLSPDNCALMRERGSVVWLRARPETLLARVGGGSGRPLLGDDPEAALRRIVVERQSAYTSAAHFVVDVDGCTADQVADAVLAAIKSHERAS